MYDVIIIGGGASGLYLASRLARTDKRVLLIERNDRLGKKLSATGNGQGNITNLGVSTDKYFGSVENLGNILLSSEEVTAYFDFLCTADESGRVYPSGRQASAVTDFFRGRISCENITVKLGERVEKITEGFEVKTDKCVYGAPVVAIATGGKAGKQFGTDGDGYALAESLGHTVTPLYPSLVQLKTQTDKIKTLRGIRTEARLTATKGKEALGTARGDLIFAEYGVTGNAVFAISPYICGVDGVTLHVEFLPDVTAKAVEECVRRRTGRAPDSELLSGTLHSQIGRAVMRTVGEISPKSVANAVKDFTLAVTGTLGFDNAQVTRGGVRGDEVDDNLQSKKVKGLYFCGEVLDVDGLCGGFNLHFAFSSAERVYRAIK